jgi:hypothetical protein
MGLVDPRRLLASGTVTAALAFGAGCVEPSYAEPVGSPTYVEGASVPGGGGEADGDVVDVGEPPVADVESYPSVEYEGFPVYYVGGSWYQRGPHGWRYYRHEPRELGRVRAEHGHEAQWVRANEAPHRTQQPVEHPRAVTAPEPRRAPEPQPPEHRATPAPMEQPRPAPVEPPHLAPPPPHGATPPRVEQPRPAPVEPPHAAPPPRVEQPRPAPVEPPHAAPPPPAHGGAPPPTAPPPARKH